MNGTIYLGSLAKVAEFLAAFSKENMSDVFVVSYDTERDVYKIVFNGVK